MAVEIGALRAFLSLDSAAFEDGVKRARASMTNLQKATNTASDVIAKAGRTMAFGVGALAAGVVAGGVAASREFEALQNQARIAGMAVEDFKILSLAAREFGIEQDKLSDVLKDVNDKIGDFAQTGGGPLKDFFEQIAPQVGLTLEAFEGLSSSDALALYVKALEDANVSQADMTFYMEAIASDATALVPLFQDNAAAIKQMADRAAELGLSLDEGAIAAAAKARSEFRTVADVMKTRLGAAFAELTPAIAELAESVLPLIISAMEAIKPVIETLAALLRGDFKQAWETVSETARIVATAVMDVLNGLAARAAEALRAFGQSIVDGIKAIPSQVAQSAREIGKSIVDGMVGGIKGNQPTLDAAAAAAGRGAENAARRQLETKSPSRVFERIGSDLMEGLSIGIAGGAEAVADGARSVAQSISSALTGALMGTRDFGDEMRSILQQLASDLISSGLQQAFSALFGGVGASAGGSFLGSLFGGFRANGGPVMPSRAYVVGERGPELFVPSSAGNIVPNGGVGGGVSISIDARGAQVGVAEQIDRKLAERLPDIQRAAVGAVQDSRARGRMR